MTAAPWLVPIVGLRRATGSQREEHRGGHLGELRVADVAVPPDGEVDVDVTLTAVDGGVDVAGTVSGEWEGACRRCLRPVGGRLTAEVREVYRPVGRFNPAVEGDETAEETYALGSDHLDLEPLARDALLLALPLAPLCRQDCPGLSPVCGADLTDEPCGCAAEPSDPRWAALDVLRAPVSGAGGATAAGRD